MGQWNTHTIGRGVHSGIGDHSSSRPRVPRRRQSSRTAFPYCFDCSDIPEVGIPVYPDVRRYVYRYYRIEYRLSADIVGTSA
jgi:hypothetical protein